MGYGEGVSGETSLQHRRIMMFVEINTDEILAKMPPKRREAIEKALAKEFAKIDAMQAAEEAKKAKAGDASSASSGGAKSSGTPMAAAPVGK